MESEDAGGGLVPPRHLRDHLLSHGRHVVDVSDVMALAGTPEREATATMTRLRKAGQFFAPTSGLYVAIPPEYATWGVVPAMDFIGQLMAKLDRRYYVGLLSAAELHGAAHQRPQVFQVIVDRRVADRDIERVRLRFYTRRKIDNVPTVLLNSATGQVRVSAPEATALDLAGRPKDSGGLSNVATVVGELVLEGRLAPQALAEAARIFPRSAVRRLGWLLDLVADEADTVQLASTLHQVLAEPGPPGRPVDLLDPTGPRRGNAGNRWHVVENTEVEPDL